MEKNEIGDVSYLFSRISKSPQTASYHAGTGDLVMVEGDAAWCDHSRLWLANVVQKRCESPNESGCDFFGNRNRMGQDVLVSVNRVLFEGQRRYFR